MLSLFAREVLLHQNSGGLQTVASHWMEPRNLYQFPVAYDWS